MNDSRGSAGLFLDDSTQWCQRADAALPWVSLKAVGSSAWGGTAWRFRAQPWVQVLTPPVEEGGRLGVPHLIWAWAIPLLVSTGSLPAPALCRFVGHGLDVLHGAPGLLALGGEGPPFPALVYFPLHLLLAPLCGWFPWALRPPGLILVPPSSPLLSPLCHQWILCISCSVCWEGHPPCLWLGCF